jgi:hypothetical protein
MALGQALPISEAMCLPAGYRKFPDRINPPDTVASGFLLPGSGR